MAVLDRHVPDVVNIVIIVIPLYWTDVLDQVTLTMTVFVIQFIS